MFKINGNSIALTRGDTASFDITIKNADGTAHPLAAGDTVKFTVKKSVNDSEVVLQKTGATINLAPADTAQLAFGEYVYDVQVDLADGSRHTIIEPSPFELRAEVNWT